MPYINQADREDLNYETLDSISHYIKSPGRLTYVLYKLCKEYGLDDGPVEFWDIAEVLGALEATKLEFYRRIAAPHEDTKIVSNGDV